MIRATKDFVSTCVALVGMAALMSIVGKEKNVKGLVDDMGNKFGDLVDAAKKEPPQNDI